LSLTLTVPGKTFLAGEYLALSGGPALIFASKPLFCMEASVSPIHVWPDWHPESPAGAFLRAHADYFSQFKIQFHEAYEGRGGFGASTAQFLSLYALWILQDQTQRQMDPLLDFRCLLSEYERFAWQGQGQKPSGADLIGQLKGSYTFFEKEKALISVKSWPFAGLEFLLISTGNKLPTHEHLRTLPQFPKEDLQEAFSLIRQSIESSTEEAFAEGINQYARALQNLGFTCQPTVQILTELRQMEGVRACKGCGALGADVVLVVCAAEKTLELRKKIQQRAWACLSGSDQVSPGLQVRGSL
jgi:mevalonate kinase